MKRNIPVNVLEQDRVKLIKLLKVSKESGYLPKHAGLCYQLREFTYKHYNYMIDYLELFTPNFKEKIELMKEMGGFEFQWWGRENLNNAKNKFTETRETILCFIIAMIEYDIKELRKKDLVIRK
jgi:hypothetical protein